VPEPESVIVEEEPLNRPFPMVSSFATVRSPLGVKVSLPLLPAVDRLK